MRDERGYSLIEVMAALAIIGFVITVTMMAFMERNKRMLQAREMILAYQALANEAEHVRRTDYLNVKTTEDFQTGRPPMLAPLEPYETAIEVEEKELGWKNVTMTIRWGGAKHPREAQLIVVRTDTGGSNLW